MMIQHPSIAPPSETSFAIGDHVRWGTSEHTGVIYATDNGWYFVKWDKDRPHSCCPHFGAWELTKIDA